MRLDWFLTGYLVVPCAVFAVLIVLETAAHLLKRNKLPFAHALVKHFQFFLISLVCWPVAYAILAFQLWKGKSRKTTRTRDNGC